MLAGAGSWSENCSVTRRSAPGAGGDVDVMQYTVVARWRPPGLGNCEVGVIVIVTGDLSGGVTNAPAMNDSDAWPSCVNTLPGSTLPSVPTRTAPWPGFGGWLLDANCGGGEIHRYGDGGANPS